MEVPVRRGGVQTPDGFLFELTGGDPSLDLTNTLDNRPTDSQKELLVSFSDLLSWSTQAGVLNEKEVDVLRKVASKSPSDAEKARRRIVELRECLYEIFSSISADQAPPVASIRKFDRLARSLFDRMELVPGTTRSLQWKLKSDEPPLNLIFSRIVRSALNLLQSEDANRIRECAADNCAWLFIDHSKKRNRKWCDMSICGNRAKARRFYAKRRHVSS